MNILLFAAHTILKNRRLVHGRFDCAALFTAVRIADKSIETATVRDRCSQRLRISRTGSASGRRKNPEPVAIGMYKRPGPWWLPGGATLESIVQCGTGVEFVLYLAWL